jgi:hypothetical protein
VYLGPGGDDEHAVDETGRPSLPNGYGLTSVQHVLPGAGADGALVSVVRAHAADADGAAPAGVASSEPAASNTEKSSTTRGPKA